MVSRLLLFPGKRRVVPLGALFGALSAFLGVPMRVKASTGGREYSGIIPLSSKHISPLIIFFVTLLLLLFYRAETLMP